MEQAMAREKFSKFGLSYTAMSWVYSLISILILLGTKAFMGEAALESQGVIVVRMLLRFAVIYPIMYLLVRKLPKFEITKKKMGAGKFIACIFITCAVMYISNIFGTIINSLIGKVTGMGVMNPILDELGGMHPAMHIILAVILAPIFEEILFRKILIDRIVNYGEVMAMLISGLMFGLFHANLAQGVYTAALGMFFAFVYIRTGKIGYTIALHMIINSFGTFASMIVTRGLDINEMMGYLASGDMDGYMLFIQNNMAVISMMILFGCFVILSIIVGVILMIALRKHFVFKHHEEEIEKGNRFATSIFNVGMIIYVIYWGAEIVLAQYGTGVFDGLYNALGL